MKQSVTMRLMGKFWNLPMRTRVGLIAFVLLAVALVSYVLSWFGMTVTLFDRTIVVKPVAACLRTGAPMFFLWLAWPDIAAFPKWVLQASIPLVIIVALYPKLLLIVIPTVLLLLFLQPKQKKSKK